MKKYIGEFIGTALLVFFGCGITVAATILFSAAGMLPAAFASIISAVGFGLLTTILILAFGDISGGHLNPVISLSLWVSGRMKGKDLIGYVIGQFAGGICGAALLAAVIGGRTALGANGFEELSTFGTGKWVVFLIEAMMTFTLVWVVLAVRKTDRFEPSAAVYTGLATAAVYLFGYPFSGASANPARSLGPALLQDGDAVQQVWMFILAPVAGALVASVIYKLMTVKRKPLLSMEAEENLLENEEPEYSEAESEGEADSEEV